MATITFKDRTSNGYDFEVNTGSVTGSNEVPTVPGTNRSAHFANSSILMCDTDFTECDGSDVTIETWIKQVSATGDRGFANKNGIAGLNAYIQDNDTFVFQVNGVSKTSSSTLTTTDWTHIAFAYDKSAGTCKIYKNGSAIETFTGCNTAGLPNNTAKWSINANATAEYYLAEYRVWNTLRSDSDISDNYQQRLTGQESGLIVYLPFNVFRAGILVNLT